MPAVDSHAHVFCPDHPFAADREYTPHPTQLGTAERFAAVADPFSGEVFFTEGERARVRHDGSGDALLTHTSATRLVDVNLVPQFPGAAGRRARFRGRRKK